MIGKTFVKVGVIFWKVFLANRTLFSLNSNTQGILFLFMGNSEVYFKTIDHLIKVKLNWVEYSQGTSMRSRFCFVLDNFKRNEIVFYIYVERVYPVYIFFRVWVNFSVTKKKKKINKSN